MSYYCKENRAMQSCAKQSGSMGKIIKDYGKFTNDLFIHEKLKSQRNSGITCIWVYH